MEDGNGLKHDPKYFTRNTLSDSGPMNQLGTLGLQCPPEVSSWRRKQLVGEHYPA